LRESGQRRKPATDRHQHRGSELGRMRSPLRPNGQRSLLKRDSEVFQASWETPNKRKTGRMERLDNRPDLEPSQLKRNVLVGVFDKHSQSQSSPLRADPSTKRIRRTDRSPVCLGQGSGLAEGIRSLRSEECPAMQQIDFRVSLEPTVLEAIATANRAVQERSAARSLPPSWPAIEGLPRT